MNEPAKKEPETWEEAREILDAKYGPSKGFDLSKVKPVDLQFDGPTLVELIIEERRNVRF
jgi:hypothetical protein